MRQRLPLAALLALFALGTAIGGVALAQPVPYGPVAPTVSAKPLAEPATPPAISPTAIPSYGPPLPEAPPTIVARRPAFKVETLPGAGIRMWLGAPTPRGIWTLRIDNEDTRAMRIPADVRLLHIEVDETDGARKKTYRCELPAALRPSDFPDRRALLLAPGESYAESFDPHLFCFGKNAKALEGGNVVRAYFGWNPKVSAKTGPWVVEATDDPSHFASARAVFAPTGVLSFTGDAGASWTQHQWMAPNAPPPFRPPPLPLASNTVEHNPEHYSAGREARIAAAARNRRRWDKPVNIIYHPEVPKPVGAGAVIEDEPMRAPIVDERAARLELEVDHYIDAATPRNVALNFKLTNVGQRKMLVVLRSRMVGLDVHGPDGDKHCEAQSSTGAVPRDAFRTMRPGDHASMRLLLSEICSLDVFSRPGLYKITARFDANESGSDVGLVAYTGVATSSIGYIRVSTGLDPFYATTPRPVYRDKLQDWE